MQVNFPREIRKILDLEVMRLWDSSYSQQDLNPVGRWFEVEGHDWLGMSLQSSCIYLDALIEFFSDSSIIAYGWAEEMHEITDPVRLEFIRHMIQHALEASQTSVHVIEYIPSKFPPADLCFLLVDNGPGGYDFQYLDVYFSFDDFLTGNELTQQLIFAPSNLSEEQILGMWHLRASK